MRDRRPIMKAYVVGFYVSPLTDEVLLIRKRRPRWQAGLLNGIGGKVEPGETADEAMAREFKEEAGLKVLDWQLMVNMTFPVASISFYRALTVSGHLRRAITKTDERIEVHNITELLWPGAQIVPNLRWLLPLASYTADRYDPFSLVATVAEVLP